MKDDNPWPLICSCSSTSCQLAVGAAALLEDHEQRPVVYSRQLGPIDAVRRDSILHRSTSPELMSWFRSFGILRARRALRIPAHPELDILARVCAPAWYRDRLLGFLWLIADEEAICDSQLPEIEKAADHAALMLYEERLAQRLVVQALTHLFSPSEELRDAAASQLIDQSLLREGEPTAVVVLQALPPSDQNLAVIEEALLDVGWEAPTGALLRLACSDHGVMLVRLQADDDDTFAATMAQAGPRRPVPAPGRWCWAGAQGRGHDRRPTERAAPGCVVLPPGPPSYEGRQRHPGHRRPGPMAGSSECSVPSLNFRTGRRSSPLSTREWRPS